MANDTDRVLVTRAAVQTILEHFGAPVSIDHNGHDAVECPGCGAWKYVADLTQDHGIDHDDDCWAEEFRALA